MKKYKVLMVSAVLLYVTYLAAKNIYTSEIIEIVRHFDVSKSDAVAATSFSFVTYALAQVVFVKIIQRLNVKRYLLISSPISVILLMLVPYCTDIRQVWVIFAFEGVLLSGVFPICMLVISEYLPDSLVPVAERFYGAAFALSFALDYLFSALFIKAGQWQLGFFVFPALYMCCVLFFCRALSACPRKEKEAQPEVAPARASKKLVFAFLFFAGMIGFLVNMIYYAVSGWVPNLLSEQFGLTPALSVLIALLIPLTGAAGCVICLWLCGKFKFVPSTVALSLLAAGIAAVLGAVYKASFLLTLTLVVVFLMILRGLAHVFGWQEPINARRVMNPSSAATVINIFGCVGAAVGPVVSGAIADAHGYTWFFVAAAVSSAVMAAVTLIGRKEIM